VLRCLVSLREIAAPHDPTGWASNDHSGTTDVGHDWGKLREQPVAVEEAAQGAELEVGADQGLPVELQLVEKEEEKVEGEEEQEEERLWVP